MQPHPEDYKRRGLFGWWSLMDCTRAAVPSVSCTCLRCEEYILHRMHTQGESLKHSGHILCSHRVCQFCPANILCFEVFALRPFLVPWVDHRGFLQSAFWDSLVCSHLHSVLPSCSSGFMSDSVPLMSPLVPKGLKSSISSHAANLNIFIFIFWDDFVKIIVHE